MLFYVLKKGDTMANNEVADQISKAFSGFAGGFKVASRKRELKELMEKGYLSFYKNASANLFMQEHKEEGYILKFVDGAYRIFPPDDEITSLNKYINDENLAYMCGLVKIFKDFGPLSVIFTNNNDDTLLYSIINYNFDTNSTIVLGKGIIPYSTELQIKALPTLLVDLKNYNQTTRCCVFA